MIPHIYIVTPCLNPGNYLDETIKSILSQTDGSFFLHYHVQDGGSDSETLKRLEFWQKTCARNSGLFPCCEFSFDSTPDKGMYDAINAGFARFEIAGDSFMRWVNADDPLWPGALSAIAEVAGDLPEVDWLIGWLCGIDRFGTIIQFDWGEQTFPKAILEGGLADGAHWRFVQQENTFWRYRLWQAAGGVEASFQYAGDWDLWRRFARKGDLCQMSRQLGAFRLRPNQKSADVGAYQREIDATIALVERNRLWEELGAARTCAFMPRIEKDKNGRWVQGSPRHVIIE